jgi:hypothetical protein
VRDFVEASATPARPAAPTRVRSPLRVLSPGRADYRPGRWPVAASPGTTRSFRPFSRTTRPGAPRPRPAEAQAFNIAPRGSSRFHGLLFGRCARAARLVPPYEAAWLAFGLMPGSTPTSGTLRGATEGECPGFAPRFSTLDVCEAARARRGDASTSTAASGPAARHYEPASGPPGLRRGAAP